MELRRRKKEGYLAYWKVDQNFPWRMASEISWSITSQKLCTPLCMYYGNLLEWFLGHDKMVLSSAAAHASTF